MKKSILVLALSISMMAGSAASWAYSGGSVKIYQDKNFMGHVVNVGVGKNISDFKHGTSGSNDKCSSVAYNIPDGWTAILYTDTGYKGREYAMSGTSNAADIGDFEDKCSSIQWVRMQ